MPETHALVDGPVVLSAHPAPLVHFLRAGHVESIHYGHVAVVDASGRLLAWAGNPRLPIFPRSSFKPFQALPLVESGAFAASGLGADALALIAGSHSGTDRHAALALSILEKAGATADDLRCSTHEPYDEVTAAALRARGEEPGPLRHNCSGKHAGMLLLARHLGAPLAGYTDPAHPVQRAIFDRFASLTGKRFLDPVPAIDGCSVPTPRVALSTLAHAFALLASGVDAGGNAAPALAEIRDAMRAHPENVAGEGRLDTLLMRALCGDIVCKVGAEGVHATGHPKRGIGIALKIIDGSRRALKPAVVGALDQVGILSLDERGRLDPPEASVLRNHAGIEVGEVRPALVLERETR